jgi:AraC-like DNA-binding protein
MSPRKGRHKKISDEALVELFNKCKTISELSTATGYNPNTVRQRLKNLGLKLKGVYEKRVPDESLVKLVNEGKNISQIANITGYRWSGVKYRLNKLGLKAKKGQLKKKTVPDEIFAKLTKEGKTRKQMQAITGLAYGTVYQRLKALGLKSAQPKNGRTKESIAIDMKIAQLRQDGFTYQEIGKRLGLSRSAVHWRAKRMQENDMLQS